MKFINSLSLRFRMVLAFIFVTMVILIGTWLLTKLVLPKVYEKSKLNDLTTTFDSVTQLLTENEYNWETKSSLDSLRGQKNVAIIVVDITKTAAFVADPLYSNGSLLMRERMLEILELRVYGFRLRTEQWKWKERHIQKGENYDIYQMFAEDPEEAQSGRPLMRGEEERDYEPSRQNGTYFDLLGRVGDKYYVYLSIDYASIYAATSIATGFQLRIAIAMLVVASVVIFLLCRSITRPIEKMSKAAQKMCNLDFATHCPENRNDEIGELGKSLNVLSDKLETTISDLKQANNELQRDIKRKEEIESMRRDFISNVSHELKTPIALIQGYAEGLQDNINDDPENREYYCEVIIDEAMKMNEIVRKLLSLNQLEYGEEALEYDRFDIMELLDNAIRDTEILQKQQNVHVTLYGERPCFVWADEYRIEEVVTNYISNAFHYVSRSKKIAISVKKTDATIRVSVYNTGEPIPEEDLDKVWIKFYKVDKARTREYGGSGIGLSLVKAIMDLHNRECGVINHEGGVEFWFELESADGKKI